MSYTLRGRDRNSEKGALSLRGFIRIESAVLLFLFGAYLTPAITGQAQSTLVARWRFDEGHGDKVHDSVSENDDQILNYFDWVKGATGNNLKFDGFTTMIERAAADAPKLRGGFTIETWLAIQSYPWNWVAIVDQDEDRNAGYFFGIDAEGRLGLQVSVWGVWEICRSEVRLPLNRWVHVAGVYDPRSGIHLYIDGKPQGQLPVSGDFSPAEHAPIRIGRNLQDLPPVALVRKKASFPAKYSFDGILSDLEIFQESLTAEAVLASYEPPDLSKKAPPFVPRHWPKLPEQGTHLEAAYTSLNLYPEWDRLWRTGPYSDVVVSFGRSPIHYVFWRGANFGPCMVTDDGIWMSDQSLESSTPIGTAEHMNDKHDMHASISIVENSPARVVLHWRYALADVLGNVADVDPNTDWGDWADEDFYIYPDGVAVRHGTIHGTRSKYSFTEPTLLLEPGKKPEDYISLEAATIGNEKGESRTYSWDPTSPQFPFPQQPENANVAILNLKSRFKPFYLYRPGTALGPYGWPPELRPQYSHFPVWDHWPVNQIPSDGRFELFPDHFGSSAIMSPNPSQTWINAPGTKTTYFLFGMTDGSMEDLARLDRSWLHPPTVNVVGGGSAVFDAGQRAYILEGGARKGNKESEIKLTINASEASPLVNPAFVVNQWGDSAIKVRIDGAALGVGGYQVGYRRRLDRTDLVFWLDRTVVRPVTISISAD